MHPRTTALSLAAALACSAAAASAPLPDLSAHLWRERVLVIDAPDREHEAHRDQAAALLPDWAGLRERDLHIVTRFGGTAFRVRLVGKDGGVKLDSGAPVAAGALFDLIDAMPMRRAESAARPAAQTKR